MKYFPVFFDLDNEVVVLVGNSQALAAKLANLVKTNARLLVFSEEPASKFGRFAEHERMELIRGLPSEDILSTARLVYLDSSNLRRQRQIFASCKTLNVAVNTIDDAGSSDFISAAIVDRDPVTVAISSSGSAPVLVRRIKAMIEELLESDTGAIARLAQALRPKVKTALSHRGRLAFWQRYFDGSAADRIRRIGFAAARKEFHRELDLEIERVEESQPIALVGAGPGDPELLTIRARRFIERADVVLYDRLVDSRVVDLARREAKLIAVGKRPGGSSWSQAEINRELIQHAKNGERVVRLKSGDPMIFGRADEEIDAIQAAQLNYEVIPGITAASAASASIGRSMTRRDRNSAFNLITAHDVKGFAEHDWKSLAAPGATSAIYMGVRAARFVQGRLLVHGARPDTPMCVVENAARDNERVIDATLGTLHAQMQTHRVRGPAIIFIGLRSRQAISKISHALPAAV